MHNLSETHRNVIADAREIISNLYDADDGQLHLLTGDIAKLQELLLFLKVANEYDHSEALSAAVFIESENEELVSVSAEENAGEVLTHDEIPESTELTVDFTEETFEPATENPVNEQPEEELISETAYEPEQEIPVYSLEETEITEAETQTEPEFAEETTTVESEYLQDSEWVRSEEKESQMHAETEESVNTRGQIVDFTVDQPFEHSSAGDESNKKVEGKLKLASIKGLRKIQSLFDEDPLEAAKEEASEPAPVKGDLQKRNVPTDYLEAVVHPEFKLDLNDRIAFTKILFDGSQTELNQTIKELNSFKTLEEAKEFLSDQYYARKWNKSDEYAQRLWSLVESRFH